MAGQERFVAKVYETVGRRQVWGVYDRKTGSWPVERDKTGYVKQAMTSEAEAEAEAQRVREAYASEHRRAGRAG